MAEISKVEINKVEAVGSPANRRQFLEGIGAAGLSVFAGLKLTGASEGSIGFDTDIFKNHPFGAVGGYVDNGTLILPSGTGVSLGAYGNPILKPAILHGAPLESLNPNIVNLDELAKNIIRAKEPPTREALKQAVGEMRLFQVLVKDGDAYRVWDVSQPSLTPPSISVGAGGELEIKQGDKIVVSREDGIYLRGLYHVDVNRIDKSGLIGIFELGSPPSESDPIAVMELDTPMVPTGKRFDLISEDTPLLPAQIQGEVMNGEKFIRVDKNLWRYRYENGTFTAESKAHAGLADSQWDQMGGLQFYSLQQQAMNTVLMPDPDLGRVFNAQTRGWTSTEARVTGVILWTQQDGVPGVMRTSLTNLGRNNGTVSIEGNELVWRDGDKPPRNFRINELRSKPCVSGITYDLYAVEDVSRLSTDSINRNPVVHRLGEFDIMEAYRAGKRLVG